MKNFPIFDLINQTLTDDSFGNNSTTEANRVETANTATYASYLMTYNLVQNSSNLDFVNEAFGQVFNPNADGVYSFYLAAFDPAGAQLARTDINVIVGNGSTVPEPASLALLGIGMVGLVAARRRKQTTWPVGLLDSKKAAQAAFFYCHTGRQINANILHAPA